MQPVDISLIGALMAAIAAMSGVLTYMGRWFVSHMEQLKSDVNECRKDREKLWERIAQINDRLDCRE